MNVSGERPEGVGKRRLYGYLLAPVLVPVMMIVAAFFVIPSNWFEQRSGYEYLVNLGYGAKLKDHVCGVAVYGDSTAMVGVDPAAIERETGLTACNIAEFEGMTLVNGTMPVDMFLARNPRPRFLVFVYAPENLSRPKDWQYVSTFEAISFRVKEKPDAETAWVLARHPTNTLTWVEQGMRMALERLRTKPFPAETSHIRERAGGQLKSVGPALTDCGEEKREYAPDAAWIAGLRTKYGVEGTTVIVDATPAMECDAGLPYYDAHLRGLVDDYPYPRYPVGDYLNSMRMHMNATGSAKLSAMIGEQVRARMMAAAGGR